MRDDDKVRFNRILPDRPRLRDNVHEPPVGPAVLANIAKAEYISEEGLFAHANMLNALLVKICWASRPGHTLGSDALFEAVRYGAWAGDRIRMTSLGRLLDPGAGREWKDITPEVNVILERIWRDRYPELFNGAVPEY